MTSANSLSDSRTVLLYAVTSFQSHVLVDGLINLIPSDRYKVHFASSPHNSRFSPDESGAINYHSIPMKRNPHLLYDFLSLLSVFRFLLRVRPAIINYSTPKAALLYAICAYILRVPTASIIRGLRFSSISSP